jgi:hypothetical protein
MGDPDAAPPGAPPVSDDPAESAGEVDEWKSRALIAEGEVSRLDTRVEALVSRVNEWHGLYVAAEAKCRKLEGKLRIITDLHNIELERNCNRDAPDYADRLTLAAQAARGALEPFARKPDAISLGAALGHVERAHLFAAREALASLVAVLPRSGGAEWDQLRGSAPDATGSASSEDFVRKLRSDWPDPQASTTEPGPSQERDER